MHIILVNDFREEIINLFHNYKQIDLIKISDECICANDFKIDKRIVQKNCSLLLENESKVVLNYNWRFSTFIRFNIYVKFIIFEDLSEIIDFWLFTNDICKNESKILDSIIQWSQIFKVVEQKNAIGTTSKYEIDNQLQRLKFLFDDLDSFELTKDKIFNNLMITTDELCYIGCKIPGSIIVKKNQYSNQHELYRKFWVEYKRLKFK